MFKQLSIKGKMLTGFGCVIMMAVAIAILALISMSRASDTGERIRHYISDEVRPMFTVYNAYNSVHAWLHLLDVESDMEMVRDGVKRIDYLRSVVNQIPSQTFPDQYRKTLGAMNSLLSALEDTGFMTAMREGRMQDASNIYYAQVLTPLALASEASSKMLYAYMEKVEEESQHLDLTTEIYVTLGITIACTIIALLIASVLHSYIVKSITAVMTLAHELRNGNFCVDTEMQTHNDEVGAIYKAFGEIAETLNRTVAKTIAISVELEKNSKTLNNSSKAVIEGAQDIEQRAISIAASSDEMVSTTSDIAKNCHAAQETSETARVETNAGVDSVRATVTRIKEQAEYTKEDASKVLRLVEQASKISSIVNTIEDIASQTNLLALNAAIEAARAGEAGRGFAVVADEVRALASRTSQSTKEISAMVAGVQTDSEDATKSITASVEQMQDVADQASNLEISLNKINDAVNAVNAQIIQIATAAEEQINATSEISDNMQNISNVAQQATDVASNSGHIAQHCDNLITGLLKELDFFRLDESKLSKEDLNVKRIDEI